MKKTTKAYVPLNNITFFILDINTSQTCIFPQNKGNQMYKYTSG